MVVQLYADESYKENKTYVLAGYMARAQDWAKFSQEWEGLLPSVNLGNSNKRRFKMSEMANSMDRVPPFYEVIRRHARFAISLAMDESDLNRAKSRIWSDNTEILFSNRENIQGLLFRCFIQHAYGAIWQDERVKDWLEINEKIDLYFDENSVEDVVSDEWDVLLGIFPEHILDLVGSKPRFVNDEDFLPVQAADFWAWWVREGYEKGRIAELQKGNFESWQSSKVDGIYMSLTEDQITSMLIRMLKKSALPGSVMNIYDEKTKPRTSNALDVYSFPSNASYLSYVETKWKAIKKSLLKRVQ